MKYRIESDSMGEVKVPADRLWGAQAQRSLENFKIGSEVMPAPIIKAFGVLKKAAALTNLKLDKIDKKKSKLICDACDKLIAGDLIDHFPLVVWQTGSGTQTNMNVNEVISNLAAQMSGLPLGMKIPIHPNDDVNKSQSSNDTFPTAMNIAAVEQISNYFMPALDSFINALKRKEEEFKDIVKIGRTHLMDAVPITLGQEFSGYRAQLQNGKVATQKALEALYPVALGGSAVGTGLNTHPKYSEMVAIDIAKITGKPFTSADNKFESLGAHDSMIDASSAMKRVAASLIKIANDIRWLGSGPRSGLGEILLPATEPGSSIMPGKVNPTHAEAITMACVQVIGNDTAITIAASQGNFELNVYRPLMIYNLLQSITLLTDSMESFRINCLEGIKANEKVIKKHLNNSLMLVTALNQHIGYDKAANAAKNALDKDIGLKESITELGYMDEETFDKLVVPKNMTRP